MGYVIKNHRDGSYLVYDPKKVPQCRWVDSLEDASLWADMKKAHNFMNNNYRSLMRFVPATATSIIPLETTTILTESIANEYQEAGSIGDALDENELDNFDVEVDDVDIADNADAESVMNEEVYSGECSTPDVDGLDDAIRRLEALPDLNAMLGEIRVLCRYFEDMHRRSNLELTDILHKIELGTNMSAAHRAVLYKKLQTTLRNRRTAKDSRKRLNLYYESGLIGSAGRFVSISKGYEDRMGTRKYAPRALPELFEGEEFVRDMSSEDICN